MKEKFKDSRLTGGINITLDNGKVWHGDKGEVCEAIIRVCNLYYSKGDTLTLRQLYYQLVSKDIIPNHDKVYKKISSIKDDIVFAGLVDWSTFEDRGRVPISAYYEESVKDSLQRTVRQYKLDRQIGQPTHIEVWTEKDAISGILKKVTLPYSIKLVVNKGYSSSTAMYQAYERFADAIKEGKKVKILYFGDHDPSGLDMVRDINDRIKFMLIRGSQLNSGELTSGWFTENGLTVQDLDEAEELYSVEDNFEWEEIYDRATNKLFLEEHKSFEIEQIGLTKQQIARFNPPPNPAKITDPRAKWYLKEHGTKSWEVDALTPESMRDIVRLKIQDNLDKEAHALILTKEALDKDNLNTMIKGLNE